MATYTVTNSDDSGAGSLRSAIDQANNTPGEDIIQFSFVSGTITLTTDQLYIIDSLVIRGSGANNLFISGNRTNRVFNIYNPYNQINVTLDSLTITNGSAYDGGGISNKENLIITNSSITQNVGNTGGEGDGVGGGINNSEGTLTLINSTVSENTAFSGGGINNNQGTITIINSTISGNTAIEQGSGINNGGLNSTVNITSTTIADNTGATGGLFSSQGNLTITNTIISRNSGGNLVNNGNLAESNNILVDSDDLRLGALADNGGPTRTHALGEGSSAIDRGSNNSIPNGVNTDQRGQERRSNEIVDIGAFEFIGTPPLEFDPASYGASNPDLIPFYVNAGYDLAYLTNHYLTYGRFEGRPTDTFDADRYTASSYVTGGDLINVFGLNDAAATLHYINNGFAEGRSKTAFDPARYLNSYDDLLGVFGTNTGAGTQHFITNGFTEGRDPNQFQSDRYLASYGDLINTFAPISDYAAKVETASNHYLFNGRGEGRQITFDPAAYLMKNSDVAADLFYAIRPTQHYIEHGYSEGRMTM